MCQVRQVILGHSVYRQGENGDSIREHRLTKVTRFPNIQVGKEEPQK